MPNAAATQSITVADLNVAKQAAMDALDAALDARAFFLQIDERESYARRCERAAALLTRLGYAARQTRAVELVERAFTEPAGVGMPGVGSETNAHRLALRLASVTFHAITSAVFDLIVAAQKSLREKAVAARKAGQEPAPEWAALFASFGERSRRFADVLAGRPRKDYAVSFTSYGDKKPKRGAPSVYRLVPTDYTIGATDVADVLPPGSPWAWFAQALELPAEPDRQGFTARVRAEYLTGLRFAETQATATPQVGGLTAREKVIVKAAVKTPGLTGEALAEKVGSRCNSAFKKDLSHLVKRGFLKASCPGYIAQSLAAGQ